MSQNSIPNCTPLNTFVSVHLQLPFVDVERLPIFALHPMSSAIDDLQAVPVYIMWSLMVVYMLSHS